MFPRATPKINKTITTLFLKRFPVNAKLVENNVCGGYNGKFEATLSLTCMDLDSAGFVTHNEGLLEEIRYQFGQQTLKASCEELAAGVVNVAFQMMNTRLISANARVFNLTGHAEVIWDSLSGFKVPSFPRAATNVELGKQSAGVYQYRKC